MNLFNKKNHIGRPSNEKLKRRRSKKIIMIALPIILIGMLVAIITSGSMNNLMGNSIDVRERMKPYYLGDFDLDGKITENDYSELSDYISQVNSGMDVEIDDIKFLVGDVNKDGEIYDDDLTILRGYFEKSSDTYRNYYEKIGVEKICLDGYTLSGNYCVNDETIKNKNSSGNDSGEGFFTVYFDANQGRNTMSEQQVNYGVNTVLNINNFVRDGYLFSGWHARRDDGTYYCYTSPSNNRKEWTNESFCKQFGYVIYENGQIISETVNPGHSVTMIAQWATASYTIRFDASGGQKSMDDQKIAYGKTEKIKPNSFAKDGYYFVGWYADRNDGLRYCYLDPSKNKADWTTSNNCDSFGTYTFANNQNVKNLANDNQVVTLHAQWKENKQTVKSDKITIKFDGQGGTIKNGKMDDMVFTEGETIKIKINKFQRDGYKFVGWKVLNQTQGNKWECRNSEGESTYLSAGECGTNYVIYDNQASMKSPANGGDKLVLYAQWEAISTFTIKYNANGGTGKISDQIATYGATNYLKPNVFVLNGYKFIGWLARRNSDGKELCFSRNSKESSWVNPGTCSKPDYYNDGAKISKTVKAGDTVVMIAQWTKVKESSKAKSNNLTIRFDGNGATKGSMSSITLPLSGGKIPANKFKREGFNFIGWKVLNNSQGNRWECTLNGSRKYYTPSECGTDSNYVKYKDQQVLTPASNVAVGDELVLYAQWEPLTTFTIKYNGNGAKNTTMSDQIATYGETNYLKQNAFVLNGYKFIGWLARRNSDGKELCFSGNSKESSWINPGTCSKPDYYNDGAKLSKTVKAGDTVVMIAQWTKVKESSKAKSNNLTIRFDGNGATKGSMSSTTLSLSGGKIPTNQFKRTGYKFVGWKVLNNSQGNRWECTLNGSRKYYTPSECGNDSNYVKYKDQQVLIPASNVEAGDELVLYAQWEPTTVFTIKYDGNGATKGSMTSQNATYGSVNYLNDIKFEKNGYIFKGWKAQNEDGKQLCFSNGSKESAWVNPRNCDTPDYYSNKAKVSKTVEPGQTVTMIAQWKNEKDVSNTITIKYDGQGGTYALGMGTTTLPLSGGKIHKNLFERKGYKFKYWKVLNQSQGNKWDCTIGGSRKYYSQSDCGPEANYTKVKDGATLSPASGIKAGDVLVLYAVWEKEEGEYTVSYDANGGNSAYGKVADQVIKYGVSARLRGNVYYKNEYDFLGWYAYKGNMLRYCKTQGNGAASWVNAANCYEPVLFEDRAYISNVNGINAGDHITMKAQWKNTYFTVKFDGNGASSGKMIDQKIKYGNKTKLRSNEFHKRGYVFKEWYAERQNGTWLCYTDPSYSNTAWVYPSKCYKYVAYDNGESVAKTAGAGTYVTMHAQWKSSVFTVRYDGNGADSGKMDNQTMHYGEKNYLSSNKFKKNGYAFKYWEAERSDGTWYCYTDSSRKNTAWVKEDRKCYDTVKYDDGEAVYRTATPGTYVTMHALWRKPLCSTDYKCTFGGEEIGGGPSMRCQTYYTPTKYECEKGYRDTKDGYCTRDAQYLYTDYRPVYASCNPYLGESSYGDYGKYCRKPLSKSKPVCNSKADTYLPNSNRCATSYAALAHTHCS